MKTSNRQIALDKQYMHKSNFFLLCTYVLFEFGRPQTFIPSLSYLHIPMFVLIILFIRLFSVQRLVLSMRPLRLFLCLLCLMAIHVPIATNNHWAMQTTKVTFLYFVAACGITFFLRDFQEFESFLRFFILCFIVLAFVGVLHKGKVTGSAFLGDENDFALAMNFALPFILFSATISRSQSSRLLYIASILILIASIILSRSRGGFVGFIPVAVYCWLRLPKKIASSVVVLLLLVLIAYSAPRSYWNEIRTIREGTKESTAAERIYYWKVAWRMFLDNPIIGVGPGNFPWNILRYEDREGYVGRFHGGRVAHSLYFTLIPELGIVGTLFFVLILLGLLKNRRYILKAHAGLFYHSDLKEQIEIFDKIKYYLYMIDAAMLSYFFTGIFISVLYYPYFWILCGLSCSLRLHVERIVDKIEVGPS